MRFLLLETIHEDAHARLSEAGDVTVLDSPDESPTNVDPPTAIFTRGRGRVTAELLDRWPTVRVVARSGVGLDNVDVAAATARGIAVINAPGSTTQTTAEHTLLLILSAVRELYPQASAVKQDDWSVRNRTKSDEAAGKTLGVVGLGAIGSRVAELATAIGMKVIGWNRTAREEAATVDRVPLEELWTKADVISLHVALTDETRHLVDADVLARTQPGTILINSARGGLIDPVAVTDALDRGQLLAYAADGLDPEPPPPDDPLVRHPRCLITPHSAALTESTYRRMCLRTVDNVLGYLLGREYEDESVCNRIAP